MPLPPLPHVFDSGLRSLSSSSDILNMLVRQQLDVAVRNVGMMNFPLQGSDSEDLVAELGEYFARTALLWAQLTEQLVHAPQVAESSQQAHERSRAVSHLSDLAEVARIDVNMEKLRRIRNLSVRFSQEVQEAWRPELIMLSRQQVLPDSMPQFREANFPAMAQGACFSNEGHLPHFASHRLLPGKSQIQMGHPLNIHADVSGSDFSSDDDDDDDEEDEQFQSIDMNALRQRGKGVYYCPKGVKCDKGGVDKDGNLVVFDRNSSFAQHCNKHRKPWRCDVPGCPNPPKKRRFARRDGLERHKATVKHYMLT
ncbi:hypothetical protein E4U09_000020 [Claviceps aff. purpurea]|uniref:Uncharacterized protein n=1 Tax=Claviceps aff. purpurea TaxID=1967640 RepID=A0A9P7QPD1_9HYPO|nr:hypothetical protein E4U09_000020 [Claviceps aff. purpurea]